MKEVYFYISLILLTLIFWEDYRFRAVSWILFPSLFVSFFLLSLQEYSFFAMIENISYNFFFLFLILLLTTIYFSLKHKKIINISNGFLGWGDILFLLTISVIFSPVNYMLFYLASLFIVTLVCLFKFTGKAQESKIPLAGMQALLLAGLMLLNKFFLSVNLWSDEWLLKAYFNV